MKEYDYLLKYQNIQDMSIHHFQQQLNRIEGMPLKDLRLQDLSYFNGEEIWPGQGVYLFRNVNKVVYVGKVSSMSFTERIGKHFDCRHYAWFNMLIKLIARHQLNLDENNSDHLKLASRHAFDNLNIVLINFDLEDRERIDRIERLFRSCLDPLNRFKSLSESNLERIIGEYE